MFSTNPKKNICCQVTFLLSSANAFNLDQSKYLSFGKGIIFCTCMKSKNNWIFIYNDIQCRGKQLITNKSKTAKTLADICISKHHLFTSWSRRTKYHFSKSQLEFHFLVHMISHYQVLQTRSLDTVFSLDYLVYNTKELFYVSFVWKASDRLYFVSNKTL